MKRSNMTITPIVIVLSIFSLPGLATVFAPASQARQKRNTAPPSRPQHEELVKQWLASRPELRLATDADYAYKADLAAERIGNESYHPYYAVGDFNGDGQEDFAVALVNRRKHTANFAIAVFNGSKVRPVRPLRRPSSVKVTTSDVRLSSPPKTRRMLAELSYLPRTRKTADACGCG